MLLKRSLWIFAGLLLKFTCLSSVAQTVPSGAAGAAGTTGANNQQSIGTANNSSTGADQYDPTTKAAPVMPLLQPTTTGTRALIWEVKSADGLNVAFLFGTIHVGKASFYPLPAVVDQAFRRSAKLVVEANITDQKDAAEIGRLIDFPKGETIEKHISPQLLVRLKDQLARSKIPYANVAGMRPVMLGGLLPIVEFVQLGYEMNQGLDLKLTQRAQAEKKPILELESSLAQIQLLTSMSPQLQEAFLENAIAMLEQGRTADQVTGIVNAWQLGDAKLLVEITDEVSKNGRMVGPLNDILLGQRHPAMLAKIEGYLSSNVTHFIAVGALHLVGKTGLIEMLMTRGYKIRQL